MLNKIKNLILTNKKFSIVYFTLILLISLSLCILSILGNIERTGYLSNFEETLDNYYSCKINYYNNKFFRHSDIFGVYPYFNYDTDYIFKDNEGSPFCKLLSYYDLKYDDKIDIQYRLKLKIKFIAYILLFILILPIIYFFRIKIKYYYKSYILLLLLIHSAIYFSIFYIILPKFSLPQFKFNFADFLITYISTIIVYKLLNKNKLLTSIFIGFQTLSFFIIEPIALTFQNTVLLFTDIPDLYPTLINVLSFPMKIVTIAVTIIYFSIIIILIIAFIYNLKILKKITILSIIICLCISSYILFFRPRDMLIWDTNFIGNANQNGIIDTINFRINYDKLNNQKHSKKEVENALSFLIEKEQNRDVSSLLLKGSKDILGSNKRNIFLIFLESFYDYSHFISLFEKDPFPEEYRKWANNSQKISPIGGGSFYARLAGLTASSPLYPKTQSEKIDKTLISLLNEGGYYTLALEESDITYNLDNFLPSIDFKNIIFKVGATNIDSYIENNFNNLNKPIFLYGFTWLGHQGSHIKNNFNIKNNNKNFFDLIQENDIYSLVETMDNSVMAAMEIIKIKDTILKYSPNALIIFEHDHLYASLIPIIERSNIDENIKKSFLEDSSPSPLLIWDGTNGAYKAPVNIVPENIPMFIAINAGATNYKNSIISLLYKENIDNTISTYHKYYKITNNSLIIENNIDENSEIFKYENAQKILSQDIFQGKKYYYELIDNLEKTN
ncbi:hypothetical protein NEI00_06845 [Brachyspira pilosicoli]|uniref:hypothetical protein n=1 Tax=Brachyspira pilosicoli TaxID=52584 RepID=UPI002543CA79|nr:hypothetical protein [Brachyspira pilosicoli]WIH82721.1 hypothetical protein NEI00_06845 [Brachyspira pilosicoli]